MQDVVVTTYGTLASEVSGSGEPGEVSSFSKLTGVSPLLSVYWDRVVLDEAHSIKVCESAI